MATNTDLIRRDVVHAFLRHQGKVLLLRRNELGTAYGGRWEGLSAYLREAAPKDQALRAIRDALDLSEDQVRLVSRGEPLRVAAPELATLWVLHPLLFDALEPEAIRPDWERLEVTWAPPNRLPGLCTAPHLTEALQRCLENAPRAE
jgi:hypothetical protein